MPPILSLWPRVTAARLRGVAGILAAALAGTLFAGSPLACSDSESDKKAKPATDASTTTPIPTGTTPSPSGPLGPSDGGIPITAGDAGPTTGNCAAGMVCLDVTPMRPNGKPLAGRLAIMWAQLNREGPDPVAEVGYDVAFLGTEKTIDIPLAQVTPPTDPNFLCQRNCNDEYACPCINEPKVAVGYVVVVDDDNKNGKADLGATELESENFVGVGAVGLAYSVQAYKPVPAVEYDFQRTLNSLLTDSIAVGVVAYTLIPAFGGANDAMGAPAQNTRFKLPVCDTIDQNTCVPAWPNYP
jgi:hypothetical protein